MYEDVINKLKEVGVVFADGLDEESIREIEKRYQLHFPEELKAFYREGLPVSEGFYRWNDFSDDYVAILEDRIIRPKLELAESIDEVEWSKGWGLEPADATRRTEILLGKLREASPLIPIYKHRYLGSQYEENNPVFSIYGTDIIYYGENLSQFLMIEFKYAKYADMDASRIPRVDFWSDMALL